MHLRRWACAALGFALGVESPGPSAAAPVPSGRHDTGRSISLEAVIDAPPSRVFEIWTTPSEIPHFFAPKAVIEPRLGGKYEMIFDPEHDPMGDDSGTHGATILRFVPNHALSFEWTGFSETGKDPYGPVAWPEQRAKLPIATWIDLEFDPIAGQPGKTRLRLQERGFGSGGKWDTAIEYFWRNWALALGRLGAYCANGCEARSGKTPGSGP